MPVIDEIQKLLVQVKSTLTTLQDKDISSSASEMANAERIYVVGQGRSGLVAHLFAIRLNRLGFRANIITEDAVALSQPIKVNHNVVVAISGSGETEDVITYIRGAKERKAKVIAITSFPSSRLAKLADNVLVVKGRTKKWEYKSFLERELSGEAEPVTSEGSLFEISALVLLEAVATEIAEIRGLQ